MTKVLLTGGSGFIASHILEQLLANGHSVITTVRTQEKAQKILRAHNGAVDRLQVAIVPDIACENAFSDVAKMPGIEVVIHTASPCHLNFTDPQKELVDPAVLGTINILRAIKRDAPQVRRVIITSSFAAIVNIKDPSCTLTEQSWNPNDLTNLHEGPAVSYCVAKTLAERRAWDFIAKEKPNFDLTTVNPPLVFGPVVSHFASVNSMNTSNEPLLDLVRGKWRHEIPDAGPLDIWIDVRDVAAAHIAAMDRSEAGGKRLLPVGGRFSNAKIANIVRENVPQFKDRVLGPEVKGSESKSIENVFTYNNDMTNKILGIKWTTLDRSIIDFIESIKAFDLDELRL